VKLDSSILKQLIKEELQNLLQEESYLSKQRKARAKKKAAREAKNQAEVDRKRKEKQAAKPYNPKHSETPAEREKRLKTKTEKPTTTKKAETKETAGQSTWGGQSSPPTEDWESGIKFGQTPTEEAPSKKEEEKKSTFTREQGSLRRKINQLKKDGKIDEKTWRAARNALYKGTGAANAVLQKAGVGGRGAEGTRTAGGGGGQYRRAQQPLTPQEHATAVRLYNAVKTLMAEKHPQFQNIWQVIMRAARYGHKIAAAVVTALGKERRERERQVTQATQTRVVDTAGA